MNDREALTAYTAAFVDELAQNQILHAVVSPGSRSTPLALMLADHPDIKVHINVDERSAGFFALGLAKALKKPVVLLCTSGTAAANYYPAIVEANNSRVPLVVLTADRPPELRDVGAPQTIDQLHLYGNRVKWFVEMAIPENSKEMVRYARTVCARAIATAACEPSGPVHLNFPLRDPLVPDLANAKLYRQAEATVAIEGGVLSLSESQLRMIAGKLNTAKKGIIICGDLKNDRMKDAITSLAEKIGFPILADPLSQLRSGQHSFDKIMDCYDTLLRDEKAVSALTPDMILRFGAMPVSKSLLLFLKKQKQAEHFVVDGGAGWREPAGLASQMVYCDEERFCKELSPLLSVNGDPSWSDLWKKVNDATKHALTSIDEETELNEAKLFLQLNDWMPNHSNLFVGNSMPIRDLDTFFFNNDKDITIYANRGANGIDGIVSTALGVSTVKENTVLVIGDLSFFHDMNGMLAGKLQKQNMTILLINNDGGGIFSFLPQSSEKEHFELLFGTPHSLDFSHAAKLYEADYQKVASWEECKEVFSKSFSRPGVKMIEVPTNRETNVLKHRNLWNFVSREIANAINEEIS
jgi:2-succinyl-5-enolpyruvyl-6-hydroxy-3-cyclohexene-1-carboxylate synthase